MSTNINKTPIDQRVGSESASNHLGVSAAQLKVLRERRLIPYIKIGHRTILYQIQDLDRYINRCKVSAVWEKSTSAEVGSKSEGDQV